MQQMKRQSSGTIGPAPQGRAPSAPAPTGVEYSFLPFWQQAILGLMRGDTPNEQFMHESLIVMYFARSQC